MAQQDYSYPTRHPQQQPPQHTVSSFAKRLSVKSSKKYQRSSSPPHGFNNNGSSGNGSLPKWNDYYANGGDSSPNLIKVVVVGEHGAGKSNLIQRLTEDRFDSRSKSTIGIDFALYEFTEPPSLRTKHSSKHAPPPPVYKAQIWDTAGQERYRSSMTKIFYRDVAGALLVCDLTNREHFIALNRWFDEIRSNVHNSTDNNAPHMPSPHQIPILLVGNKVDDTEHRQITPKEGMDFVRRHRLVDYVETSAKTGVNVERAFHVLFEQILLQRMRAEEEASGGGDGKKSKMRASSRKGLQRESSIKLGYTNSSNRAHNNRYQSPPPKQKKSSKCNC